MSNTPDRTPKQDKPLPEPIGEDALVHPEEDRESDWEKEIDEKDAGLTDIGGGRENERKII